LVTIATWRAPCWSSWPSARRVITARTLWKSRRAGEAG
jgi:hypothetical protein